MVPFSKDLAKRGAGQRNEGGIFLTSGEMGSRCGDGWRSEGCKEVSAGRHSPATQAVERKMKSEMRARLPTTGVNALRWRRWQMEHRAEREKRRRGGGVSAVQTMQTVDCFPTLPRRVHGAGAEL